MTLDQLYADLARFQAALDQLDLGLAAQRVADSTGGSVEFAKTTPERLARRIFQIKNQIIAQGGTVPGHTAYSPAVIPCD